MPIVLGAGPSITDYPRREIEELAKNSFTFAVNDVCFDLPCDCVVSIDPAMSWARVEQLQKLKKPLITRAWHFTKPGPNQIKGVDFILVPEDIINYFRVSGMLACKLSDELAKASGERKSYVLGIDASVGHYDGHPSNDKTNGIYSDKDHPIEEYDNMNLTQTVNLSVHSRVSYWPKSSKLPKPEKVIVNQVYKTFAIEWLRENAGKCIFNGLKNVKP